MGDSLAPKEAELDRLTNNRDEAMEELNREWHSGTKAGGLQEYIDAVNVAHRNLWVCEAELRAAYS